MKKRYMIILLLLIVSALPAEENLDPKTQWEKPKDTWTGFDKWQHFSFSLLMTVQSGYVLSHEKGVFQAPDRQNRMISAGISFSFGMLKECLDMKRKPSGFFSWKDLVMDMGGTLAGVWILSAINDV
ncbi:MAG: hypothetical protein ACP5D8_06150 [Fidelibacterota bacterium]